jgi:hypothetical protein
MYWKKNDRVKVSPSHPSGLGGRLGTVLRTSPGGLVEVDLDSWYQAGVGLVAFRPEDLVPTDKKPLWWKAREEARKQANTPAFSARQTRRAQNHHGKGLS